MRPLLRTLLAALLACACTAEPPRPEPRVRLPAAAPAEPPPIGIPHGGEVLHVAVTESGDAAVSLDSLGGVRLWPMLDGSREPIAIQLPNVRLVAISHAGAELLVAILDVSGSLRLIRYTREGRVRGSAQVPGDAPVDDVVAIDGGILVARRDRSIERYDALATLAGRITLAPGEQLGALAVRHGGGAVLIEHAVIEHGQRRMNELRWIDLAQGLQWGARVTVPGNLRVDQLAISPSHRRFAIVSITDTGLQVFDSATGVAVPVAGNGGPRHGGTAGAAIGFLDEDHVARVTSTVEWWVAATADPMTMDPWSLYAGSLTSAVASESAAIGDGLIVSGYGPHLALQSMSGIHFLGWRDPASGEIGTSIEGALALEVGQQVLTLDRRLARARELTLPDSGSPKPTRVWWLDANHAVTSRQPSTKRGEAEPATLELVDLRHEALRVPIGTYARIQRVEWDGELHTLAVVGDGTLARFQVDMTANTLTELPVIKLPRGVENVRLLDPKMADGANLVVIRSDGESGKRLAYWVADSPTTNYRLPKSAGTVIEGFVAGISPTGALYVRSDAGLVMRFRAHQRLFPHLEADSISTDRTGDRILALRQGQISLLDPDGIEQWHQAVWGARRVVFSPDGTQVVVQAQGGMVALDATTGARTATACGFSFALMTKPPELQQLNVTPVCEE